MKDKFLNESIFKGPSIEEAFNKLKLEVDNLSSARELEAYINFQEERKEELDDADKIILSIAFNDDLDEMIEVDYTNATFSDGVPVLKYFDRNDKTQVYLPPNYKFLTVFDIDSYRVYFIKGKIWYRYFIEGSPPFDI